MLLDSESGQVRLGHGVRERRCRGCCCTPSWCAPTRDERSGAVGDLPRPHRRPQPFHATAYVDATGECDLAWFVGASTRYGNQGFVQPRHARYPIWGDRSRRGPVRGKPGTRAIHAAKQAGVRAAVEGHLHAGPGTAGPATSITYLVSEAYDARSAASISTAERLGRKQAWLTSTSSAPSRAATNAYLAVTGPSFGTRESRQHRLRLPAHRGRCRARGPVRRRGRARRVGHEWHDAQTTQSRFRLPGGNGVYEIPLRALTSVDTAQPVRSWSHRRRRPIRRRVASGDGHRVRHRAGLRRRRGSLRPRPRRRGSPSARCSRRCAPRAPSSMATTSPTPVGLAFPLTFGLARG